MYKFRLNNSVLNSFYCVISIHCHSCIVLDASVLFVTFNPGQLEIPTKSHLFRSISSNLNLCSQKSSPADTVSPSSQRRV
jgi:hypothetical protein